MSPTEVPTVTQRLWSRTVVDADTGCWNWTGGTDRCGYGRLSVHGKMRACHREGYAILGPDPLAEGMVLRPRCRNRRCWNPDHQDQMSSREATMDGDGPTARHAKATHCPQRHEYTPDNTRVARGRRHCRTCHRNRLRRNRAAEKVC